MNRRHLPGNFVDNPKVLFRKSQAQEEIINTSARNSIQSRRSPEFVFSVRSHGEQIDP